MRPRRSRGANAGQCSPRCPRNARTNTTTRVNEWSCRERQHDVHIMHNIRRATPTINLHMHALMRARNRHRVFALPNCAASPPKSSSFRPCVPPGKILGNHGCAYTRKCSYHKGKARGKGAAHTVRVPKIRVKGARRVTYASSGLRGTQYRAQGIIQQGRGGHGQVGSPPTKVV